MDIKLLVAICLILAAPIKADSMIGDEEKLKLCAELQEKECVLENYGSYSKCMEENRKKRDKRQSVYNSCISQCNNNPACMNGCPACPIYMPQAAYQPQQVYVQQPQQPGQQNQIQQHQIQPIIYQQPIAPIQSNKTSYPMKLEYDIQQQLEQQQPILGNGFRKVVVEGNDGHPSIHTQPIPAGHNITTIINLKNIVNNTNVVNVPTNINSTNVNHIHIYHNETNQASEGGKFNLGYNDKGSCCFAVRPKTCRKSSTGSRCHHRRHKTCGDQCTSRIIHVQSRRRCETQGGCDRRSAYIPQPQQPKCIYKQQWPYVSCGGQYQQSCDGCYDHYGYGHESYAGGQETECEGCYDDGFDMGQLYRRGPFMRPFHYHEPPCALTGMCNGFYNTPYGYFGHDRIDPAFGYGGGGYPGGMYGMGGYGGMGGLNPVGMYGGGIPGLDEFNENSGEEIRSTHPVDGDDDGEEEEDDASGEIEDDWGIDLVKCRVVDSDGQIRIQNCTGNGLKNPYAGKPMRLQPKKRHYRRVLAPVYRTPSNIRPAKNRKRAASNLFPVDDLDSFKDDKGEFILLKDDLKEKEVSKEKE